MRKRTWKRCGCHPLNGRWLDHMSTPAICFQEEDGEGQLCGGWWDDKRLRGHVFQLVSRSRAATLSVEQSRGVNTLLLPTHQLPHGRAHAHVSRSIVFSEMFSSHPSLNIIQFIQTALTVFSMGLLLTPIWLDLHKINCLLWWWGREGGNHRQFIAIMQTVRNQLTVLVKHHMSFDPVHKSSHGEQKSRSSAEKVTGKGVCPDWHQSN